MAAAEMRQVENQALTEQNPYGVESAVTNPSVGEGLVPSFSFVTHLLAFTGIVWVL